MKLKTLKDLQLGWEGYPPEDERIRQQLRAEAMRWLEEINKNDGGMCHTCDELWKDFFNIKHTVNRSCANDE